MPDQEVDEYGIPVKKKPVAKQTQQGDVDEFGIPVRKKKVDSGSVSGSYQKQEFGKFPQPVDVLKSMKNQVGNPESFEGGKRPIPEQQPDSEHDAKIAEANKYIYNTINNSETESIVKKHVKDVFKNEDERNRFLFEHPETKDYTNNSKPLGDLSNKYKDEYNNMEHLLASEINGNQDKLLNTIVKSKEKENPKEAKKINSNIFLVTHNDYASTPENKKKLYEGAKKIESGEYKLSESGQLIEPMGFVESVKDSWNRKNEAFDRYEKLHDPALAEEVYAKYDADLKNFSPLDPIRLPEGALNKMSSDFAGMPILPLVAGGLTTVLTKNPEAGQIVGAAVGGADFGILAGAAKHEEAYKQAIIDGKSKEEARDIADNLSTIAQTSRTASGAAMAFVPGAKLSPILKNSGVINIGKQIVNNVGKEAFQGLKLGGIAAASRIGENIALNANGEKVKINEGALDEGAGMFMFHMVNQGVTQSLGALGKPATKGLAVLSKPLLDKAKIALARIPKEEIKKAQQEDIQQGIYTPEEAARANEEIDALRPIVESLPANMKDEAVLEARKIIEKRNDLNEKLKVSDPALHPEIKERVKALNEEILALSKEKKSREETSSKVGDLFSNKEESTKAVNLDEAVAAAKEHMGEDMGNEIAKDPEGALKEAAQQLNASKSEAKIARETYGEKFSDLALKMFPDEKPPKMSSGFDEVLSKEEPIQEIKNETTKEATKVPIQTETKVADNGKVGEVEQPTEKQKKQVDTIEDFDKELSDIFDGKYDKLAEGGANKPAKDATAEDYLSKGKAVLSQLFPNVEIKAYEKSSEYEAAEGRPKGSAGMFDPATNRIALNMEAIKEKGVENTIFHEVIHPIVNEVIGKNEAALEKLYGGLEKMKNEKGMEAVWEHMDYYFNRGGKIQKVEAVTEFLSLAADGKIDTSKLSKSTVTKIIDWVNQVFESLGIDKRISTGDDLKSLSDSVIKALQEGDTSALKDTLGKRKESKASEKTIADLEVKRDVEISKLMKPEVKMELVSVDDLINAKDPIAAKERHSELKEKYKDVRKLIDCLWAIM